MNQLIDILNINHIQIDEITIYKTDYSEIIKWLLINHLNINSNTYDLFKVFIPILQGDI